MFTKPEIETKLDNEIARLLSQLAQTAADSAEYTETLNRIDRLQKMKTAETRSSPRVSPDTLITAGVNLLGIAMIIRHENLNVITSKALGFVPKTK